MSGALLRASEPTSAAVEGAVGDVAAAKGAVVMDLGDGSVGVLAGGGDVFAEGAYGKYTATCGHRAALGIQLGAGVEHLYVIAEVAVEAVNHVAAAHFAGIAVRGKDDADEGRASQCSWVRCNSPSSAASIMSTRSDFSRIMIGCVSGSPSAR